MSAKNSDVILNSRPTHCETSFIRTSGGEDVVSLFPRNQLSSMNTLDTHSVIAQQAVPTNIFQSGGGYVEFVLPRLSKKLDNLTLEIKVTNTHATESKSILAACQMLDRIEYFAGTSFLMSMDYLAMRLKDIMTKNIEKYSAASRYTNERIDIDGFASVTDSTISALETRTFFLPVTECFHSLIPAFLHEDLRLRVHFAKETDFSGADSSIVLGGARILLEASVMQPQELSEIEAVYQSDKLTVRYFEPRVQRVPMSLASQSSYQVSLSNFYGSFCSLWIMSQPQGATLLTGLTGYSEFDQLWLSSASNEVMFGGLNHSSEWLQYSAARFYNSAFLNSGNVYPFNASSNPALDIHTDTHHGSFELHAKGEMLNFTTRILPGTKARQIVLIGWHASCLRVQNRAVVVLR